MTRAPLLLFPLLAASLTACGEPEELVISEMERTLRGANGAIVGGLLTAELVAYTFDEPDNQLRHGELCGCPCVDRVGEPPDPYVLTLEYDDGCLPTSSLMPVVLSGSAVEDWDGTTANVTLPDLVLDLEHDVDGSLEAAVPEAMPRTIEATADLVIGPLAVVHDTSITVGDTELVLDGTVTVTEDGGEPAELVLGEVRLPRGNIGGACPDPASGTVTLQADTEVVLDFASPGDGFVELTRGKRVSEQIDFCRYGIL